MCFQQQGLLAMSDCRLIGVSIQDIQTGSPSFFFGYVNLTDTFHSPPPHICLIRLQSMWS